MLPVVNPAVIFKAMADGAVLFDTNAEIYFGLNEVGARIWMLLPPATSSFDELCTKLHAHYPEVTAETIRQDVKELLDQLAEQSLVIPPVASEHDRSAGASRAT